MRDEAAREELLGEARVLLALPPHPALPLVREDFFDGDSYVVAMDWVDGTNLATLLAERGRPGLAPSSVLAYLAQAAEALTHLHSQSPPVIHGDVKPGNLILARGRADQARRLRPVLGAERAAAGAPGRPATALRSWPPARSPSRASDVYALAATAFALLTGAAPAGVLPAWEGIAPRAGRAARGGDPARDGDRSRSPPADRRASWWSACGPAGRPRCRPAW